MKKILFASTAIAGMAMASVASADIALFGDARLGIGYNIANDGSATREESKFRTNAAGDPIATEVKGTDDLRAVSRVRFGVRMTGESDAGITFGATIRADNAGGGQGGTAGQRAGNVFVSGAWGTLTFGDTDGADKQHVGDAIGNVSLTGLGDFNETPFISNGGGFGDDSIQFANNPEARPTVRYDYNFMGFGISASTNRDLNDIGVGASYTAEFDQGSFTGGVGYYNFKEFTTTGGRFVPDGDQWSVGGTLNYAGFQAGAVYSAASTKKNNSRGIAKADLDVLNVGLGYGWDAFTVLGYYSKVLTANGPARPFKNQDSYGASFAWNLGGGLSLNMGVAQTFGRDSRGTIDDADYLPKAKQVTVADFGLQMAF